VQGLQRFALQASLVNYQYQSHPELDYTARNYAGAWYWAITPGLRGTLTGSQSEMPGATTGNTEPNQQQRNSVRAEAEYGVDGPWRVLAGVSQDRAESQNAEATGTQFSAQAVDVGVRYEADSGSSAKYSAKVADGSYLHASATPGSLVDDQYRQTDNDASVHWAMTAHSSLDLHATFVDRRHPTFAVRDFSGLNYGGRLQWGVTANTSLMLSLARLLAAYATADSNYSETDQLAWAWSWQTSAHTRLKLQQQYQQIAYRGSPTAGVASSRTDDNRDTSLAWIWQPRTQWQISAELHQVTRDSSLPWLSYTSNQARLSGQFSY
jgi:exopolysaccharide biosynthesis operon protein EpsL